jgi:competence protein ComEA
MGITEKQLAGIIVLVVFAWIVYQSAAFFSSFSHPAPVIHHGDKSAGPVIVEIAGKTAFNGIYYLPEKSSVGDALRVAGMTVMDSREQGILHAPLRTGQTIEVSSNGSLNMRDMKSATKLMLQIPININRATAYDLALIPGIGEKTAMRIVEFRRTNGGFKTLEDVMQIPGIKEKKFSKLRKYLTL